MAEASSRLAYKRKRFFRGILSMALALGLFFGSTVGVLEARTQKGIDPTVLDLVQKLVSKPELMNINYLQYVIGFPENGRKQTGLLRKSYHWYQEPSRFLTYQLDQEGPQADVVTRSNMTINVQKSNIRLKDVEKVFGPVHKTVFDYHSDPNEIYTVSPTTHLVFIQPRNSFRVSTIRVIYQGPPLEAPSDEDMQIAYNFRRSQAILAGQNGDWHLAIPWLRADVSKAPQDPVARMKLANAYRQHLMINESINEYIQALKLSGGRPDLTSEISAALVEMRVWPAMPKRDRNRTYVAGRNGELGL